MRAFLLPLGAAALAMMVSVPLTAAAQTATSRAPYCAGTAKPAFVLGFAALRAGVGDPMGSAVECEHANPDNEDSLQQTSTGLSFYRKSTNTPTFTNGSDHWALTPGGLVVWTGESIDPPEDAISGDVTPEPVASAPAAPAPTSPRDVARYVNLVDGHAGVILADQYRIDDLLRSVRLGATTTTRVDSAVRTMSRGATLYLHRLEGTTPPDRFSRAHALFLAAAEEECTALDQVAGSSAAATRFARAVDLALQGQALLDALGR